MKTIILLQSVGIGWWRSDIIAYGTRKMAKQRLVIEQAVNHTKLRPSIPRFFQSSYA
jgi:hypothetical protein